jgi:hypothetical protein
MLLQAVWVSFQRYNCHRCAVYQLSWHVGHAAMHNLKYPHLSRRCLPVQACVHAACWNHFGVYCQCVTTHPAQQRLCITYSHGLFTTSPYVACCRCLVWLRGQACSCTHITTGGQRNSGVSR